MKLAAAALSDTGRVRKNNEDSCLVDDALGLLVVADGMGGHSAGEVASRLAVDVVREQVARGLQTGKIPSVMESPLHWSDRTRLLASAVTIANEVIFRSAAERPDRHGMGTTLVAALMDGSRLSVVHVGDSRFYLVRGGRIVSVTRDHSFVAEQVARGLLTPAEAEVSEAGNILTRALGVAATVEIDAMEPALRNGDVALLCSDGLSKMAEDAAILLSLRDSKGPFQMCHNLVQLALERGGRDNVTVVAGRIRRERLWERAVRLWRRTGFNPMRQGSGDSHD